MEDVTVPELRDRLDDLLDRVEDGETVRITRDGEPIAELRPISHPARQFTNDEVLERFRRLTPEHPATFWADLDTLYDWSL